MFEKTFVLGVILCVLNGANCVHWLMLGEFHPQDLVEQFGVDMDTRQYYTPVSTKTVMSLRTDHDKRYVCVIAASIHMKGHVAVMEGGLNSTSVRVGYITENGEPDVFYVMVQQAPLADVLMMENNVAWNSRYTIVVDSLRQWLKHDGSDGDE